MKVVRWGFAVLAIAFASFLSFSLVACDNITTADDSESSESSPKF